MALEYRWAQNNQYGTLTNPLSISDTSMSSAELASLPTLTSGNPHIPAVIANTVTREYEVVWITLHNAAATTATIQRGKESSTAKAFPAGAQWICGPTVADGLPMWSTTTLPADSWLGYRASINDRGEVWTKTFQQGWFGYALQSGADMGRSLDGVVASPPNGFSALKKSWTASGTTDVNGYLSTPVPNGGFPNRIVSVQLTRVVNNAPGTFYLPLANRGTTTKTTLSVLCVNAANTAVASTAVEVSIEATGY